MCFRKCVSANAIGHADKIQKKQKNLFNIYLWHKIQHWICKPHSNCDTNILLKSCMALMMTKLWNSAVFCGPELYTIVRNSWIIKQTRQERWLAVPGVQHAASHPSCWASLALWMWKQVWWQDSGRTLSGFACTAAHLLMTGLWEAGPLCTLL